MFSVRLMDGDVMPGVGLTRATHDVNNVLGSEQGEVAFLPATREILEGVAEDLAGKVTPGLAPKHRG